MKKLFFLSLLIFINISSRCTLFSSDGKYLIVTKDNIAKIFYLPKIENLISADFKSAFPTYSCDHESEILSISISTDFKYLVTTSISGSKMWNLKGKMLLKL